MSLVRFNNHLHCRPSILSAKLSLGDNQTAETEPIAGCVVFSTHLFTHHTYQDVFAEKEEKIENFCSSHLPILAACELLRAHLRIVNLLVCSN